MKLLKPQSITPWHTSPWSMTTVLLSTLLLSACSSHIPAEISQAPEGAPGVAQVRANTDAYLSQKVRWGGVILDTENKQQSSWLTIVAFPLNDNGRPQLSAQSPGRFIAIVDEFLEPLVYNSDREITVRGRLLRTETRKVGEFPYTYPVIQVKRYHLWPERPKVDPDYPPYWWYDPWYPPYYYWRPYHHPRRWR